MVSGSTELRLPEKVLVRKLQDEVVLLDLASEQYFGLNDVGVCVFDAIQSGADVDGAVAAVVEAFEGSRDQIQADVIALVDDLVAAGLLVVIT